MGYTKEELRLIWLDSFINLEYKHKKFLYDAFSCGETVSGFLEKRKDEIVSATGDGQYASLYNSANKEYMDFVVSGLSRNGVSF